MASIPSQTPIDIDERFRKAVQHYWDTLGVQGEKQGSGGAEDYGHRRRVTGGKQMGEMESLVADILCHAGLRRESIRTRSALELPGYFRPEKRWDLVVVEDNQLVAALEFKSQAAPSYGNNVNNRSEEAIGNATDIWTAYREGRLGKMEGFRPFLGYFFLLEDQPEVHQPVGNKEPHFPVDPIFKGASYCRRYELICKRLVLERLYDVACLTVATNAATTKISHPSPDLSFELFASALKFQAAKWLAVRAATRH